MCHQADGAVMLACGVILMIPVQRGSERKRQHQDNEQPGQPGFGQPTPAQDLQQTAHQTGVFKQAASQPQVRMFMPSQTLHNGHKWVISSQQY